VTTAIGAAGEPSGEPGAGPVALFSSSPSRTVVDAISSPAPIAARSRAVRGRVARRA
jgi:hypothetical protein